MSLRMSPGRRRPLRAPRTSKREVAPAGAADGECGESEVHQLRAILRRDHDRAPAGCLRAGRFAASASASASASWMASSTARRTFSARPSISAVSGSPGTNSNTRNRRPASSPTSNSAAMFGCDIATRPCVRRRAAHCDRSGLLVIARRQDLHRHRAAHARVARAIDLAKPACAERPEHLVMRDGVEHYFVSTSGAVTSWAASPAASRPGSPGCACLVRTRSITT